MKFQLVGILPLYLSLCLFQAQAEARLLDDRQAAEIVAQAPGAEQYPDAGALILYQGKVLRVDPDHTQELEEHLLVKILKDRGRSYGDQKRTYDERTDSVQVIVARTWLPDGSTVPVEPKAINVITPPELVGAAIYADIKQKVISFGSIGPGAVVEICTRSTSRPDSTAPAGLYPYWDAEVFRTSEPVLVKRYRLEIPENFPDPRIAVGNGLVTHRLEPASGLKAWEWEVHDEPMIQSIGYMPPSMTFSPFLVFSNVSSWELAGRWLAEQYYPAAEPDEKVSRKAAELLAGSRTRADSVRALALFVTIRVRNISLPLGVAGYEPTASGEILDNMYGHDLDKAVLLSSLLTAAGIENYPAFGSASQVDLLQLDIPSLAQFGRVSLFVPGSFTDSTLTNPLYGVARTSGLWLFPTAQYNRYGYAGRGQGNRALVVLPSGGTIYRTQVFPPEKNLSLTHASLALAADGRLSGSFRTLTDGTFDFEVRADLKDLTPRERQQSFLEAANEVGEGTRLGSYDLSDLEDLTVPAAATLEFDAPELGVVQGEMMILRLPAAPFGFAQMPYFPEMETREYDFVGSGPFLLASELEIALPEGWKVAYRPETEQRESPYGKWLISCGENAGRLTYTRRLSISADVVDIRHYSDFKAFCEDFTLPRHSILLLEKSSPKARP